jgi:acyl carrier protein
MLVEQELEQFIVGKFGRRRGMRSIGPDDDLIRGDVVDSLGLIELVDFIEERFGVRIDDDDVVIANFRDIRSIERLIDGKRPGAR